MIRKGVLRHAGIRRDKIVKIVDFKILSFLAKKHGLTPWEKKNIFALKTGILLKASNRISVSENVSWQTF